MTSKAQEITVLNSRQPSLFRLDRFDLLCVPALLLSFVVVSLLPASPSRFGDIYFHQEAQTLARAVRGTGPWSEVSFVRAPAPVIYYAIPYSLLRPDSPEKAYWQAAVVWNAFWMMLAVLLIRRTAELLMDTTAGRIAALLCLTAPFAVYYSFGVASETPAYVAAAIFMYGWALWRTEGSGKLNSFGALLSLAGLVALLFCRLNTLVVLGIAATCAVVIWSYRSLRKAADVKFAKFCVIGGLAAVLIVSAALKHLPANRGVGEQASNFTDVVFFGSFQFRAEPWDWRFWGKATREGSADYQNWIDTRQALRDESARTGEPVPTLEMKWSVNDIIHHPIKRLQMFGVRVLALNIWIVNSVNPSVFHLGSLAGPWVFLLFHIVLNAIALTLVFAAIWFLASNRTLFFNYWPLWGVWLGLLLFHAFTYAEPRYLLPGLPGLAVLAGLGLSSKLGQHMDNDTAANDRA
jgi:4-amino-4-deoxy-L-arabinose transferase-like glycosyltransferase